MLRQHLTKKTVGLEPTMKKVFLHHIHTTAAIGDAAGHR